MSADPLAQAQAVALAALARSEAQRPTPAVRADRYATGPGELICDRCGYIFDPIADGWQCQHCATTWPWRSLRREPS